MSGSFRPEKKSPATPTSAVIASPSPPLPSPKEEVYPVEPPQGLLAYASNADGDFEIFIRDLGDNTTRQLTFNEVDDTQPDWSPDGSKIAFKREPPFEEWKNCYSGDQIWTVDLSGAQALVQDCGAEEPEWSPTGDRIAFTSNGVESAVVFVTRISGKGDTPVGAEDERPYFYESPSWSPDAELLVYENEGDLYTTSSCCDFDSELSDPIVTGGQGAGTARTPSWSPRGDLIAYSACRNGRNDVYVVLSEGGAPVPLRTGRDDAVPWSWSPDGKRIFFHSDDAGSYDLYWMNNDGSRPTAITTESGDELHPDLWVSPASPAAHN